MKPETIACFTGFLLPAYAGTGFAGSDNTHNIAKSNESWVGIG